MGCPSWKHTRATSPAAIRPVAKKTRRFCTSVSSHDVTDATFPWPTPEQEGNHTAAVLLHDALRLSLRRGAGPFRSFGQVDITPRPYQLVPLMMALSQETVRLLIADDVGLGKTIEALLIARELYDRGEIRRLAVLCPPHLVDQWVTEMRGHFHFAAEPVTSGTARDSSEGYRRERRCSMLIPSPWCRSTTSRPTAGAMSSRGPAPKRSSWTRRTPAPPAPELRHQRYQLLRQLLEDDTRHAILCTATPAQRRRSGIRSTPRLSIPPSRILETTPDNAMTVAFRDRLAGHLVQRRRLDIREWHDEALFPTRETADLPYRLDGAWERFLEAVLTYCEQVTTAAGTGTRRAAPGLLGNTGAAPLRRVVARRRCAGAADQTRERRRR